MTNLPESIFFLGAASRIGVFFNKAYHFFSLQGFSTRLTSDEDHKLQSKLSNHYSQLLYLISEISY